MINYVLYRIRPGKREQWVAWCKELTARKEEVLETLRQENCSREVWVILGEYVLAHDESMPGGLEKSDDRPLNIEHRRQRSECLERLEETGDEIYDFSLK